MKVKTTLLTVSVQHPKCTAQSNNRFPCSYSTLLSVALPKSFLQNVSQIWWRSVQNSGHNLARRQNMDGGMDRHMKAGDFVFCPMLCTALDKQLKTSSCRLTHTSACLESRHTTVWFCRPTSPASSDTGRWPAAAAGLLLPASQADTLLHRNHRTEYVHSITTENIAL